MPRFGHGGTVTDIEREIEAEFGDEIKRRLSRPVKGIQDKGINGFVVIVAYRGLRHRVANGLRERSQARRLRVIAELIIEKYDQPRDLTPTLRRLTELASEYVPYVRKILKPDFQ